MANQTTDLEYGIFENLLGFSRDTQNYLDGRLLAQNYFGDSSIQSQNDVARALKRKVDEDVVQVARVTTNDGINLIGYRVHPAVAKCHHPPR
jgi:hypothetical protein